jgi:hypothetical protein
VGGSINRLVTAYLLHHGYHETATVFARDTAVEMVGSLLQTAKTRRTIVTHILEGRVDQALREAGDCPHLFPGLPCRSYLCLCMR